MQQIYRRTPMSKCDSNEDVKQSFFYVCCDNTDGNSFKWLMRTITSNFSGLQTEKDTITSNVKSAAKVTLKTNMKKVRMWDNAKKINDWNKPTSTCKGLSLYKLRISDKSLYQWCNWGGAFGMIAPPLRKGLLFLQGA